MPTYTITSTSYCRKRKGLFRRGPLRKQNRRAATVTAQSQKAAILAYKMVTPTAPGCRLKVYVSVKLRR
jgi:hypothetical protein